MIWEDRLHAGLVASLLLHSLRLERELFGVEGKNRGSDRFFHVRRKRGFCSQQPQRPVKSEGLLCIYVEIKA